MLKFRVKAYSILEIVLVLTIMGTVFSSLFSFWIVISQAKKQKQTEEKFHHIRVAMQAYLLRNGNLPSAAPGPEGISDGRTLQGFVPYKTLGIDKKYLLDSNRKPFRFVVNKNFIQNLAKIQTPPNIAAPTFCRLMVIEGENQLNNPTRVEKYDTICEAPDLLLLENGKNILDPNDYFFNLKEMPKFRFAQEAQTWIVDSLKVLHERYKVCNTIAWILVSENKNETQCSHMNRDGSARFCLISNEKKYRDRVFYQTKFDMAAQANYPCGAHPIFI
jgi:type II secretory pathway pseudopilin PulG